MGRKKRPVGKSDDGKARLGLYFDEEVVEGLKRVADRAQISVNQLMQGLARWAIKNAKFGEPVRNEDLAVEHRTQPGCIWFGRTAVYRHLTQPEMHDAVRDGVDPSDVEDLEKIESPGDVWGFLDFTERRVVREDPLPEETE